MTLDSLAVQFSRQPAPASRGLVLLEHPGPWHRRPAEQDVVVTRALRGAAAARDLRINLIRRPEPQHSPVRSTCLVSSTDGSRRYLEELDRSTLYAHLPAILDRVAAGRPTGHGRAVAEPTYLVCTNGNRSAACHDFGEPVLGAVAAAAPSRTWRISHVGGCRFAANLICLPTGVYYSSVRPSDVPAILALHESGRIALRWYRGRIGEPADIQVAEMAVRQATGLDGFAAVRLVDARRAPHGDTRWLDFHSDAGLHRLAVRAAGPGAAAYEVTSMELEPMR